MNTPVYTLLQRQSEKGHVRFCMPGHKGQLSGEDITEIGEMDNLLHPRGALLQAQTLLAGAYGAGHAWFNTCGSTMGVYALLFSCAQPGDLILLSSDCHISAVNACLLAGYRVALVYAGQDETGLPRPLSYAAARRALALYPEAKALFLTSPNYYGVCAEVDKLSELCRNTDTLLLIDAAHGAHFGFSPLLPPQPFAADGWVVSAHKTLCVQNQGSMLFTGPHSRMNLVRLEKNIHRFQTTSPSWPLIAQMDLARAQLQKDGEQAYAALFDHIQRFSASLCQTGFSVALPNDGAKDFSRLVLDTTNTGLSGYEVSQKLDSQGIWIEMADSRYLVLICTPQDCARDFARLSNALSQFKKTSSAACPLPTLPVRSEEIFTPAHAEYGTMKAILLSESKGQISGAAVCCYPPGTAIVCPGERITAAQISYLEQAYLQGASVSGGLEKDGRLYVYVCEE